MKKEEKKKKWHELPIGGVILQPGNSAEYKTGTWNKKDISFDKDKCINCGMCWSVCPDSAVLFQEGNMKGFDSDHCKKCGICVNACPVKCISLKNKKNEKI